MTDQETVSEWLIDLPGRTALAVREHRPASSDPIAGQWFLLVHGLASNARLWDGVAQELATAGYRSIAVDLRGHGRSPAPDHGYDTDTCADDLAELIAVLNPDAVDPPVVAGQSWGGNVVLSLAARHGGSARAVACVDGGWIRLADRFPDFETCWSVLAPPHLERFEWDTFVDRMRASHPDWPQAGIDGTLANLRRTPDGHVQARLSREHHREIVHSLYVNDPRQWYPRIDVPVLLMPASGPQDAQPEVHQAAQALPQGQVRYYPGADHDIHAQHPHQVARDLIGLLA